MRKQLERTRCRAADESSEILFMTTKTVSVHTQFDRIAGLCAQSVTSPEILLLSDPDSAFLKFQVKSFARTVYESDDLSVSELAAMSNDELWDLLEHLSHRHIRRPV